jgi:UDP-N-acetylglucosamine 2-epimerase
VYTISIIFGTRPEAIKLAPVIVKLLNHQDLKLNICVTGQHRQMLDQVLKVFKISPDYDLNLMKPDQDLAELTSSSITNIYDYLKKVNPDFLLIQGDTTTVLSASLASFYLKIPIGHVEAGLRTHDIYSPWPEEANRAIVSRLAALHFAPTNLSKTNLINEGIHHDKIFVVGNTIVDALLMAAEMAENQKENIISSLIKYKLQPDNHRKLILITGHRREKFGKMMEEFCLGIAELAQTYKDFDFVYPVHLNPNVRNPVNQILNPKQLKNLFLIEPLDYLPFILLMKNAFLIITDSGGIQEEAPTFGVPVLVTRDNTERPEGVLSGSSIVIGTGKENLINEFKKLVSGKEIYKKMATAGNPFGDGNSADRIVRIIENYLHSEKPNR